MGNLTDIAVTPLSAVVATGLSALAITSSQEHRRVPGDVATPLVHGGWLAPMPALLPDDRRSHSTRVRTFEAVLLGAASFLSGLRPGRHDPDALTEALGRIDPRRASSFERPHPDAVPLAEYLVDLLAAVSRTLGEEGHRAEAEVASIMADLCRAHLLVALTAELYRCATAGPDRRELARFDTVQAMQEHRRLASWLREQTSLHPAAVHLSVIVQSIPHLPDGFVEGRAATDALHEAEAAIRHRAGSLDPAAV